MQRSAFRYTVAFSVLAACGGFDPAKLTPAPPDDPPAGIAGYSFDAGAPTAGRSTSSSRGGSGDAWIVEGAAGDDADDPGGASSHDPEDAGSSGGHGNAPDVTPSGPGGNGGASDGAEPASGGHGMTGGAMASGGRSDAAGGGAGRAGAAGSAMSGAGGVSNRGGAGGAAAGVAGASQAGAGESGGTAGTPEPTPPGVGALFFSEYVEGSSSYKALELVAAERLSLAGCDLVTYSNGSATPSSRIALEGELEAGTVSVACSPSLATLLVDACDRSPNLNFNGNDAVELECGGVLLDVIGVIGEDPGSAWEGGAASTLNQTLRRRCGSAPDVDGTDAFDPSAQWTALGTDTFTGLGDPACSD